MTLIDYFYATFEWLYDSINVSFNSFRLIYFSFGVDIVSLISAVFVLGGIVWILGLDKFVLFKHKGD